MKYYSFKNFKYQLTESAIPKRKCVEVAFLCNDQPVTRFIFIKERAGLNYINEAKKIIKKEIDNGQLIKSVKKQLKTYGGHNKPLLVTLMCVFMAISLGLAGLFTYNYFKGTGGGVPSLPTGTVVEVEVKANDPTGKGYTINLGEDTKATVGSDYKAKITINSPKNADPEVMLPDSLKGVTSYKTKLKDTQYTYDLGSDKQTADLTIPGKYVYGDIKIELELKEYEPPVPPVGDANIILSDKSKGVKLDPATQTVKYGEITFLEVKFAFETGFEPEITIPAIMIKSHEPLSEGDYAYSFDKSETNPTATITFSEPCLVDNDIEIVAIAEKKIVGNRTIKFSTSAKSNFELINMGTKQPVSEDGDVVDAGVPFVGQLKFIDGTTDKDNIPLNIDVTDSKGDVLRFGSDDGYYYRFIDNEIAEVTIPKGVGLEDVITIEAEMTDAVAQFIYRGTNGLNENITMSFGSVEATEMTIDWGDGSEVETYREKSSYNISHTYQPNEDKDFVISIRKIVDKPLPTRIGFNSSLDVSDYVPVIDIDAEPIRYCSGISHIVGARIADIYRTTAIIDEFSGFIEEGLSYTGIDSFCLPKQMSADDAQRSFICCENLKSIYASSDCEDAFVASDDNTVLLGLDPNGVDAAAFLIANISSVDLTSLTVSKSPVDIIGVAPYACAGRNQVQSVFIGPEFIMIGDGAFADCPNLKTISVDQNNERFLTDKDTKNTKTINAIIEKSVKETQVKYSFYTITSTMDPSLLTDPSCSGFDFKTYSLSSNSPITGDLIYSDKVQVTLSPYAIYYSPITSLVVSSGQLVLNNYTEALPYIYGCEKLNEVTANQIIAENWRVEAGIIQNCPNVKILQVSGQVEEETYSIFSKDNVLYQSIILFEDMKDCNVIGTCSTSVISESDDADFVEFASFIFNGTNIKEILIPSKLIDSSSSAFAGSVQAAFNMPNPHPVYKVDNHIPGQSILYLEDSRGMEVVDAAILTGDNDTLILPENSHISTKAMAYNNALRSIKTENETGAYILDNSNTFFNCPNLTMVDFSKFDDAGKIPQIGETGEPENVFAPSGCQKLVTIMVQNETMKEAFERDFAAYNIVVSK